MNDDDDEVRIVGLAIVSPARCQESRLRNCIDIVWFSLNKKYFFKEFKNNARN